MPAFLITILLMLSTRIFIIVSLLWTSHMGLFSVAHGQLLTLHGNGVLSARLSGSQTSSREQIASASSKILLQLATCKGPEHGWGSMAPDCLRSVLSACHQAGTMRGKGGPRRARTWVSA